MTHTERFRIGNNEDGSALLARVHALEAENKDLRRENTRYEADNRVLKQFADEADALEAEVQQLRSQVEIARAAHRYCEVHG